MPCFGLGFSNYVHTRIFLTRTDLVIKDSALSNKPNDGNDIGKLYLHLHSAYIYPIRVLARPNMKL